VRFAFYGATLAVALLLPFPGNGSEFTTVDCPGSTSTVAVSLNAQGQIVGACTIGRTSVGFLRSPNGEFRTVSVAVSPSGTGLVDISDAGIMIGSYQDASGIIHGFTFDGITVSSFALAGVTFTLPVGINSSGVVAGYSLTYGDSGPPVGQGFVRDTQGVITTFQVPNFTYTQAAAINESGEIVGFGSNSAGNHGFIRDAEGNFTIFDVPGSDPVQGTFPASVNNNGQITGWWGDSRTASHGFTRDALGNFTTFSAHGAGLNNFEGTFPASINDSGEVTGYGITSGNDDFSFTQSGLADPVKFQDPSGSPPNGFGTQAIKINSSGQIVGAYYDSSGRIHGFIRNVLPPVE